MKKLLGSLGLEKYQQIIMFCIVGGICFVLEVSSYILLFKVIGINVYVANLISLVLAITLNYFLSKLWVFESGRYTPEKELIAFYTVSGIAILLNQAFVWLFITQIEMDKILAKILAIGIVMFFNFFLKKYLVFHG